MTRSARMPGPQVQSFPLAGLAALLLCRVQVRSLQVRVLERCRRGAGYEKTPRARPRGPSAQPPKDHGLPGRAPPRRCPAWSYGSAASGHDRRSRSHTRCSRSRRPAAHRSAWKRQPIAGSRGRCGHRSARDDPTRALDTPSIDAARSAQEAHGACEASVCRSLGSHRRRGPARGF
jgi:hypothetical protein